METLLIVVDYPYNYRYSVSHQGKVKNRRTGKFIKSKKDKDGYLTVKLRWKGASRTFKVHRLVLAAFKKPSELQVNHKNGCKQDNHLNNLEYVTSLQNVRHSIATGLKFVKGEDNPKARLTEIEVRRIKSLFHKLNCIEIAKLYEVGNSTIYNIKYENTWRHVKGDLL